MILNTSNTHLILSSLAILKLFVIPGLRIPLWELLNGSSKKEFDQVFVTMEKEPNVQDFKNIMAWLVFDEFNSKKLSFVPVLKPLLKELEALKNTFYTFYIMQLDDKISTTYPRVYDIHAKINALKLQIDRLRLIIDPEVQLALNVHTYTKIEYIAAKGMWLDDKGLKFRKFTKSLGKLSNYPKGKNDPKALSVAEEKIREIMIEEYRSFYKE